MNNSTVFKKKGTGGYYHKKKKKYDTDPIISYGLVIFYMLQSGEIQFLLQQRRDTFQYIDFLRGMWNYEGQLVSLFTLMSVEERRRIRDFTFQELWDDLFIDSKSKMYRDLYPAAKKKYESIHHLIPNILDTTQTYTNEPPWGFPKGKKSQYQESEIDCALRETEEETCIPKENFEIIPKCKYVEQFQGTNGKTYSTHYYLARLKNMISPKRMQTPHCIRKDTLSEEAQEIIWVSYSEACIFLNPRRQIILRESLMNIQKIYQ